ncbi:MAG: transcription antitermination factor NusB [Spirochaetia bacterium]|nr:transcription antitermination factor NusB [Spirochaetia bacterium]
MKPHRARILAMQAIFQTEIHQRDIEEISSFDWIDYEVPEDEKKFSLEIIKGVMENLESIDKIIIEYSKNWDFKRISMVSKAILRISLYQLMKMKNEISHKIIIDEAIKIAKEYAEEDSTRFINGILDTYYKDTQKI